VSGDNEWRVDQHRQTEVSRVAQEGSSELGGRIPDVHPQGGGAGR